MIDFGEGMSPGIVNVKSETTGRKSTVNIGKLNEFAVGGESTNYSAPVTVINNGREAEAGTYVLKQVYEEDAIEDYLRHYKYLKEHGFPVPTTVRRIEGELGLLVSDLRANNTKEVFSINELHAGKQA